MSNEPQIYQGEMPLLHSRSRVLKPHLINLTGFSFLIVFNLQIWSCTIVIFIVPGY